MAGSDRRGLVAALAVVLLLSSGLAPVLPAGARAASGNDGESGAPQRAVERPDNDGPYVNGTATERFRGSTKLYSITLKFYYPATSAGTDTPPDNAGAPYPTIIMMPYAGGDETAYDFIAPRLVSWGFVVVCAGQNQADQNSGDVSDMNDLLDQLERDNTTSGHRLCGMVDRGAFGISGHSRGGAYSVADGCDVPRLRAVQAMAPALSNASVDAMAARFSKPYQVQVGRERVLAQEGKIGWEFIYVLDGKARVEKNGKLIRQLSRGDFFGEISLIDGEPRTATVTTETDMTLLTVHKRSFDHLLDTIPGLQKKMLVSLCKYLRRAEKATD